MINDCKMELSLKILSRIPRRVLRGFVLFARARCTFEGKGLHHSWLGGLKFEFIEKSIKGAKLDEDYDTYCRWFRNPAITS